jgi:hypothetical protein
MRRKADRGEDGQGLGYVLVISAVLLIMLVALADLLWKEMHWMVRSQKTTELMHEADAAADRAIYALQKPGNWDGIPQEAVDGYHLDKTYEDVPGIRYKLRVQVANWTPYDRQIWPNEDDFIPGGDPENMRTITVFATLTLTGQHKKLQVVVLKSSLSSALFAGGQVLIQGKATDIHWGPVVSYSDASDAIPLDYLPGHPIFLAAGGITIGGVDAKAIDSPDPKAGLSVDEWSTTIGTLPPVPLDYYKNAAITKTTETGQQFYFTGDCSPSFSVPSGYMTDKTVVFYDTSDAKAWDGKVCTAGGNGVEVKKSGGTCGQGILVIMGDLDTKGTGGCTADLVHPPDCYPRYDNDPAGCDDFTHNKLFWDGFVYVAGNLAMGGDVSVYGSVYARSTSSTGGNLNIWYKSNNQSVGMLGKTLAVTLWMPRSPQNDDPASYP